MNPDFRPRWTAEPQRAFPAGVATLHCVTCGGTYPASLSGGRAHYRDCEPAPRRALPASAVGMIRFGTVAAALILVAALGPRAHLGAAVTIPTSECTMCHGYGFLTVTDLPGVDVELCPFCEPDPIPDGLAERLWAAIQDEASEWSKAQRVAQALRPRGAE